MIDKFQRPTTRADRIRARADAAMRRGKADDAAKMYALAKEAHTIREK